jgi:coenzyme F420-reducing hydrogenase beta subunit
MIDCIEKKLCTGCGVCSNICPKACISMVPDIYGFSYPTVDHGECMKCGLCIKVCPIIGDTLPTENFENPRVLAAWSLDEEIRFCSSSGGVFSEFAKHVLNAGGAVVGAKYNEKHLVEHCIIDKLSDLVKIRQSKYVQSFTGNIFQQVQERLKRNQLVAFCGAPCQVAGLLSFLKENPPNLFTFDFICRGTNSPKAYTKYLDMLENKYSSKIKKVWFKNKTFGWNRFCTRVDFVNGDVYLKDRRTDLFTRGFIEQNLYMRDCCFDCHFKKLPRVADVTLGDFWGVSKSKQSLDQDLGTSLIMVNSEKGISLLEEIQENIFSEESTLDVALPENACIFESPVKNPKSDAFLLMLDEYSFDRCFKEFVKGYVFKRIFRKYVSLVTVFFKRILCYIKGSFNE